MTSASAGVSLTVASSSWEARMDISMRCWKGRHSCRSAGRGEHFVIDAAAVVWNRLLGRWLACREAHREIDRLHVLGDVTDRDEIDAGLGDGANIVEAYAARGLERGAAGGEADGVAKLVE